MKNSRTQKDLDCFADLKTINTMKLYQALYCDCIHESSYFTISIHRTTEGAQKAIDIHKAFMMKEWEEDYPTQEEREKFPFGQHEDWKVHKTELKD
jgi:hypothetical protein